VYDAFAWAWPKSARLGSPWPTASIRRGRGPAPSPAPAPSDPRIVGVMAARLAPWTRRLRRARACSEVALVRARHADPLVDPGAVERLGRRDCPSPSGQDWSRLRARGATTWSPAHFFWSARIAV